MESTEVDKSTKKITIVQDTNGEWLWVVLKWIKVGWCNVGSGSNSDYKKACDEAHEMYIRA